MIIEENVKVLFENKNNIPVVSNVLFKDKKITVPANSVLFTCNFNELNEPVYEIADLTYVKVKENDKKCSLISTAILDTEIAMRKSSISSCEDLVNEKDNLKSSRVLHFVQYYRNTRTCERLNHDYLNFEEELKKRTTIGSAVIYLHEEDVYTADDERRHELKLRKEYSRIDDSEENGVDSYILKHKKVFADNPKPPHIHIPMRGKIGKDGKAQPLKAELVAQWLNVSPACFKYVIDNSQKGGTDGFLDAIAYGTHEDEKSQLLGKTMYDTSIYKSAWLNENGNIKEFDWKKAIDNRKEELNQYGIDNPTLLQKWKQDLLKGNKTLNDCYNENIDLYADNLVKLTRWRNDYLVNRAILPPLRQTFYIEAESAQGGEGKSLCTHALAKLLATEFGADASKPYYELNEYIFNVNDSRVSMQHYDGQPIIVLNEMKAGDMMACFGGRRGVKEFLDPFQESKSTFNVKFGDCVILAKYIIINGIQSSEDFKMQLATTKDKNDDITEEKALKQFERRIWGGIKIIDDSTMAVMFQMKLLEPSREKFCYEELCRIRANWPYLKRKYSGEALAMLEKKCLSPLCERIDESTKANINNKISNIDEIDLNDLTFEILPPGGGFSDVSEKDDIPFIIEESYEQICMKEFGMVLDY